MTSQAMTIFDIEIETKTKNKLCGVMYDTSIVPTSGNVTVALRESGQIVIGMKPRYDDYEFNLLINKEDALVIVSALVSAIKNHENQQTSVEGN